MKRILFLVLAIVVAAVPAYAGESLPPLARQALHTAQVRMDAGQFADAALVLREYMAQAGETVPSHIYLMLGSAHHQNNDRKKTLDAFQAGLKAYPDNDQLARNCAVACYELGRHADAGRLFEKAYALKTPRDPALLFHAGSAYYSGEDFSAAARVLERLLADQAQPEKDWVRLAVHAHLEAGLSEKTEAILSRYLAINPDEAPYWELLAKLHMDREEYAKAGAALEICYRLREPSGKELERLASLYAYSDAPLMASATLLRARPDSADMEYGTRIARLYTAAGRPDEAMRLLSRYDRSASLAGKKGRILYDARRFREAEAELGEALGQGDGAAENVYLLGMCAWERRDWGAARDNFMKLLGDKSYSRLVKVPLVVIEDIETARRESGD
ncbi:MAG: tetratricopeptide repeat protein [Pseudodesulfovibrio sp.]|nr:tetratricopeptide repeat protein [Pseudodesulfovibrio aespoeensis]MBU4379543.1 tetratricopeptide repeat protein [Pseudomonadota bacterium]MBV1765584.1 tetratricopeptide repeat protein [Pseudodesulfovibrio sp.]MBU4474465.1 tetratricopeptide repeat protein [Pseudomonadota bacterium]MBU4521954.1 tetratricopeptide repeat protein [Pseudomonadota bacterium]MBU4558382.1 tetratricopeptide repeat protein [Pseudomonadota bacterium]